MKKTLKKLRKTYDQFRTSLQTKEKNQQKEKISLQTKPKKEHLVIEISAPSVAKSTVAVLAILLLCFFLYAINGVLLIFFISFLFAAALDPVIDVMQKNRIPRALSVVLIYIALIFLSGIFVTNVFTLVSEQIIEIGGNIGNLVNNLSPEAFAKLPFSSQLKPLIDQLYQAVNVQSAVSQIQNALNIISTQLVSISFGLMNVLLILILTFFMTVEEKAIEEFFLSLFPSKHAKYISTRLEAVKDQIGHWLRGQLLVSVAAGFLSYIGLAIMGAEYALTLSLIAGLCMVVPVIGRGFAWVITFPIVFNQSPVLALWMSIYYFIIQQVENNVLVPYIMNKAVGLSPIIIIFAMMVGGQFLGILGLILSIPIATTISIFVHDYTTKQK